MTHSSHRSSVRSLLSGGAAMAVAGILAGSPSMAFAQSTPAEPEYGLEEIVVTAQRREENMQSVPISVTAVSAATLAKSGVGGTIQLNQIVPSVQVTRSGPSTIFYIRGVGNSSGGIGEEGANAFYVDGVYLGDLTQANTEFNNIERIEVLKGPQGTLFGRNSSGGLVNIITKEPGDEVVVNAKVGYGNYQTLRGQLYAASPLNDKISADIALTARDQNKGWGKNLLTGKDYGLGWGFGARSKVVFRPGDRTKIVLSGDVKRANDSFTSGFQLHRDSVGINAAGGPGFRYVGDYNINTSLAGYAHVKAWGASLQIEHELDWATLTSLSAQRYVRVSSVFDGDYTPQDLTFVDVQSSTRSWQQELRLSSNSGGPLNWQTGAFYYHSIARVLGQTVTGLGVGGLGRGFRIVSSMKTDSLAGFAEATYSLTDTTHLTAGARYTHDKRDHKANRFQVNQTPGTALFNAFTGPPFAQAKTFNKVTYRVALRQELTDKINVYGSYNRGFKSGIYSLNSTPGSNPVVKPQVIDAFEVGMKSELFDNMLRFNIAGFHYKIKNYQVRSVAPGGGGTALLLNAGAVKVDGVEADFAFAPTRELRITGNATYLDSRYSSFLGNTFYYPNPAVCNNVPPATLTPPGVVPGRTTGAPTSGGNRLCFGSAKGNQTPESPKFAASLAAVLTLDVGSEGKLISNILYSYTGRLFFEAENRLQQKAVSVINGAIEYRPSPSWGVELFVNNLTDKQYYHTAAAGTTGDHAELAPPRTYGVNLTFDF